MTITTALLIEHREAIEPLVRLFESEWAGWYNERGASARGDLSERMRRNGLPLGIIAFAGGELAGTCALTVTSGGLVTERSPWVGGLLVAPPFRRRGVASALLARALVEARRLGHARVHALTAAAGPLFVHEGWTEIDTLLMDGAPHRIFARAC